MFYFRIRQVLQDDVKQSFPYKRTRCVRIAHCVRIVVASTETKEKRPYALFSIEYKAAVLKKLLPPENLSILEVTAEEAISEATLYNWRQQQAKERGISVMGSDE